MITLFLIRLRFAATFNEKLLLGQGLCINPLKTDANNGSFGPKSLAEVVRQVDNQKDLHEFILSHEGNPGAVASEQVKYERHPVSSCIVSRLLHGAYPLIRRSVVLVLLLLRHLRNHHLRISACLSCHRDSLRVIYCHRHLSNRIAVIDYRSHLILPHSRRRPLLRLQLEHLPTQSRGHPLPNLHPRFRCQWQDLLQWIRICNQISLL